MAGRNLTGDFAKLGRWAKKFDNAPRILEIAARNMADEALTLVADGFKEERAPDGKAWQKLKTRKGKILQDTGRLKASWHRVRVSRAGFTIAAGVEYAAFHQHGARNLPARPQVPIGGRLPLKWKRAMVEAAREAFGAEFGG